MSRAWHAGDFAVARSVPAPLGLSRTLAHALFGAALGSLPGVALAEDKDAATTNLPTPSTAAPADPLPVAASAEQRTYGPSRPGLGTPANTMAPGEISVETGLVDWQRDDAGGTRSDTVLIGSTTVRVGVTRSIEMMVGWTPFGHVRVRDASGAVDQANRVGDATLGFKVNLSHPDGSGLSAAIQPFAILPIGRMPVGVGDWGGGVVAPISYDLSKTVNIALTGEVDAATDSTGKGRHLSYGVVGGVGIAVTSTVKMAAELSARRDDDPIEHLTQGFASLSLGWSARSDLQIDIGTAAGLNRNSPDFRLYGGISRRF